MREKYTINGFCLVCGKGFQYPYGRWHVEGQLQSGSCSKACEAIQEKRHVDTQARCGSSRQENEPRHPGNPGCGLLQEVSEANA